MIRPAEYDGQEAAIKAATTPVTEPHELTFRVSGMHCAGCAASVQGALEAVPNVQSAAVSLTTGRATVVGEGVDPDNLIEAIRKRGFGAEQLLGGASPQEMRSEIELRQERNARQWKFRAVVGLSIWAPLETLHWIAHIQHWHYAWITWLMVIGSTVVFAVAGGGFYRSAYEALKRGTANMDTLISMGATTAYIFSAVVLILKLRGVEGLPPMYFTEAAALLSIISLGHWIEARATARAGSAVRELLQLQPDEAEVLDSPQRSGTPGHGGTEAAAQTRTIPSADVEPDMFILLRPGGRAPVDGVVVEGESEVDESVVTGESLPVPKNIGDDIIAGSVNTSGRLIVRATVDGRHTTVARIADLVQKAQSSKADIQRLADRICAIFVPTVITIAVVTFLAWWLTGDLVTGVISAVTVLIISCPCALGLATPLAVMVGAGAASRKGVLIKTAGVFEQAGKVTHVVFDKTGTLTRGEPIVVRVDVAQQHQISGSHVPETSETQLLTLAAAAEQSSEHPVARAIVEHARQRGVAIPAADKFEAIAGQGVRARVGDHTVEVLRDLPDGQATCRVLVDGERVGAITVADEIRDDARQAVSRLRQMGLKVTMLTGDRREVALEIGRKLGLDESEIVSDATPQSKTEFIESLTKQDQMNPDPRSPGMSATGDRSTSTSTTPRRAPAKHRIAMVGDGINDAAALARADIGIAMASGTNVAIESATVVIPGDRVMSVPLTIGLARRSLRTIKQNLVFAFMYNVSAIPAAAFGLLGVHGPLIAALAMAASDLMVVGNALRLKLTLDRTPTDQL